MMRIITIFFVIAMMAGLLLLVLNARTGIGPDTDSTEPASFGSPF